MTKLKRALELSRIHQSLGSDQYKYNDSISLSLSFWKSELPNIVAPFKKYNLYRNLYNFFILLENAFSNLEGRDINYMLEKISILRECYIKDIYSQRGFIESSTSYNFLNEFRDEVVPNNEAPEDIKISDFEGDLIRFFLTCSDKDYSEIIKAFFTNIESPISPGQEDSIVSLLLMVEESVYIFLYCVNEYLMYLLNNLTFV